MFLLSILYFENCQNGTHPQQIYYYININSTVLTTFHIANIMSMLHIATIYLSTAKK